jgi:hypothetical protein
MSAILDKTIVLSTIPLALGHNFQSPNFHRQVVTQ